MSGKERFIEIYQAHIRRPGSQRLLEYLQSPASDFFEAPASTRFHGAYKGGLVDHSLNVYLHDLCKINVYHPGKRNVKINGEWQSVDTFEYHDALPYGHGEKSVYMITGFMRLSRDESFAIRYHMGFSSGNDDPRSIGYTFEHFPLAFALSTADMEATYFLESSGEQR